MAKSTRVIDITLYDLKEVLFKKYGNEDKGFNSDNFIVEFEIKNVGGSSWPNEVFPTPTVVGIKLIIKE